MSDDSSDENVEREHDRRSQLAQYRAYGLQPPASLMTPSDGKQQEEGKPRQAEAQAQAMPVEYDEDEQEQEYQREADEEDSSYRCEPPKCR